MSDYYRSSSEISFVTWDEETVIYNHGSACTHVISNIPAELLHLIFSQQDFSDSELLNSFARAYPENSQKQNNNYIQELKFQLISKELIENI